MKILQTRGVAAVVQDSKRREVYIILIFKSLAGSWKTLLLSLEHLIKRLKTEETTTIYILSMLPVHVELCVDLIIRIQKMNTS